MRSLLAILGAFVVSTAASFGAEARGADKTTPADFPAAGTLVTIAEGDPRIKTVDGVRVGKWCGMMFCPFAGTSVKLIGNSGRSGGMADIYVDGIYQQTADWYSDKALSNVTVFAAENLTDGRHVLEVLTRGGTKSAEFKGRSINWSRIEYIAGAHPERFVPVRYTQFVPNVRWWLDDHGEPLQCHMGGVMYHDGLYYMVGSDWPYSYGTDPSIVKSRGHCIYSSPDLLNWTYLTSVFFEKSSDPADPFYKPGSGTGRPKLLRAGGTGKFVVLLQYVDSAQWTLNVTAAAVADKPEGPYQWHGILQYDGKPMQGADTAVFTDDDGTQYLIGGKRGPGSNVADCLYQLTPDCLHVEKAKVLGTGGEAPAIFKHDGVYYLLHSHLTGWGVNDNFYHTATNIWGPWQAKGVIAKGKHSAQTFKTQTTDVVPVAGKKGAFIWIGDSLRNDQPDGGCFRTAGTVWLPVTIKAKGEMEIWWRDNWDLSVFDVASGMIDVASGEPPLPVRFDGTKSSCVSGKIVSYEWDFGDGTTAREAVTAHTYQKSGTYTAKLTVRDEQKRSGMTSVTITVSPADDIAPVLVRTAVRRTDRVVVMFSKPVQQADAEAVANYMIDPGIKIIAATLGQDRMTVTLTTSPLNASPFSPSGEYALTVKNIRDCARKPNMIAADTRKTFRFSPFFARWKLDEGKGAEAADAAGNKLEGTLKGGPVWTNVAGRAGLCFDGVDDIVEIPTMLEDLAVPFTFTFWVNPAEKQVEYANILGNHVEAFGLVMQQDKKNTNLFGFGYGDGAKGYGPGSVQLASNEWQHVAVVCGDGKSFCYINGVEKSSGAGSGVFAPNPELSFRLGQGIESGRFFRGLLSDVRIYRGALTAAEVQKVMRE